MKKTILILFLLLFHTMLFSQDYKTAIGLKLYPGLAAINSKILPIEPRFSISGGLDFCQNICKSINFETGIYLNDRGAKHTVYYIDSLVHAEIKEICTIYYYYLSLPLSVVYVYKGFYVGAGANFNYKFKERLVNDPDSTFYSSYFGFGDNFLVGVHAYFGYEFNISQNVLLSINAKYDRIIQHGFTNLGLGVGLKYVLH